MLKTKLKGGSLSGTYLISDNGNKYVRKEVSLTQNREYGFQRWCSQLKRLQRYSILYPNFFPKILKYGFENDIAYFDMEYMSGFITAHEFLTSNTDVVKISKFTNNLINKMSVLHNTKIESNPESIYLYIREEVDQKLFDCNSHIAFVNFINNDFIYLNGEKIPSFVKHISNYKSLFNSYKNPAETFTHGNLTLENILYCEAQDQIVFIDPYEENIIDSKLTDYSQILQSSNSKYELLNNESVTINNDHVSVNIVNNFGLNYFNELFVQFIKTNCSYEEYKVIKLLEISQFIRMLPFKKNIDEDKMFLFYALASKLFSDLKLNTSWNINTTLNVNYSIKNSPQILNSQNKDIASYCANKKTMIIVDEKVANIYIKEIEKYFVENEINYHIIMINGIELNKNLDSLLYILREMEKFGVSRKNEPIIGIGGGVVLDVVGLAATLYRRGIPYIRIPTTLLGIIDVSVAAKTGINFEDRRNRLGSYYPPIAAFLDKTFIKTLDPIEISSGLGEILKMAIIKDNGLFEILESNGANLLASKFECDHSDEVINLSIQGMKEELENNLWEKNLKRIVDFGHSFSPIIEMRSLNGNNPLTHGQAVTIDIIFSCIISYNRKLLSYNDLSRIISTAKNMNLPVYHESFSDPLLLLESLQDTVKHRNGDQNLPTPIGIGKTIFINDLTYDEIRVAAIMIAEFK